MSLTQALAALIVDTLPSADAREKARAGLLDFLAVTLPLTRGDIDDSGLKSLRQVYRANDAQSRARGSAMPDTRWITMIFMPIFAAIPLPLFCQRCWRWRLSARISTATGFSMLMSSGWKPPGASGSLPGPGITPSAFIAPRRSAPSPRRLRAICRGWCTGYRRHSGIAATQASGLRAQFGSEAKPLHAGLAAQAAVSATLLALSGFHGQADKVLDAFLTACCAGAQQTEKLTAGWGPVAHCSPGAGIQTLADLRRNARRRRCRARYSPRGCSGEKTSRGCNKSWKGSKSLSHPAVILRPQCANRPTASKPASVWNM